MCVSLEMVKRAASPPDAAQTLTAAGDSSFRGLRAFSGAVSSHTAANEGVFSTKKYLIYIYN